MIGNDLYAILEVEPTVPTELIRRAYFRLAKIYHPDRQAAHDPNATERFLAIQQAYEILSDPRRREEYERFRISQRASGQASAESEEPKGKKAKASDDEEAKEAVHAPPSLSDERDARMAFMKAEDLVDRGFPDHALRAMKAVVRAVPDNPDYLSLTGYLLALHDEKLHTARDYCRRAVQAEPYNPDYHARLGYVYLKAGLNKTAKQCFAAALEGNPHQAIALAHSGRRSGGGGSGILASLKRMLGR